MDKEFLMDYEEREKEEIKKFGKKFSKGNIKFEDRYPPAHRFKLNEPYSKSIDGERIWNQIPLYGTTIITLKPTRKEIFEKVHGFDVEDIDRLIDFAKETKRVQFALDEYPTHYIKMDFLEPVFRELKPPKLIRIPLDWIISDKEIGKLYSEMKSLMENSQSFEFIIKYVDKKYPEHAIPQDEVKRGIIYDLIRLKLIGYEDFVEDFARRLTTIDAMKIIFLLESIHGLFLYPFDPLKEIKSFKRIDISQLHERFLFNSNIYKEIELPCEIGKFLNDKLKLIIPKNLDGAIELSDEYNLYELRKVMKAHNEAVEKEKIDVINEKSKEISQIFENVWSEADKLKRKIIFIRYGISFGIGIIGTVATLPIAGVGGLLSGLGFNIADKVLDTKAYESISKKIVQFGTQSHIIHVYDFKKKYKLL